MADILVGLVKKLCIADQFAPFADRYFSDPRAQPGFENACIATFAFAMQIYFDFSGYTNIAIGSARLLGFDFPANFRRPYLSVGFRDFWRRWNITLSTWLRDYLYIPLGGNRHGTFDTYRNLFITMLLGGLWHGANWTFVLWGAYQGALLSMEHAFRRGERKNRLGVGWFVRVASTFVLVLLGWVFFRATSFADIRFIFAQLAVTSSVPYSIPVWLMGTVFAAFIIEVITEWNVLTAVRALLHLDPDRRFLSTLAMSTAAVWLIFVLEMVSFPGNALPFVYFKF